MVEDRQKAEKALKFFKDYVAVLDAKKLDFPLLNTLSGYKTMKENEQKKEEDKGEETEEEDANIDERYSHINDFRLKYIKVDKEFMKVDKKKYVLRKDNTRFGDTLKMISPEVKTYFRVSDFRECLKQHHKINKMEQRSEQLRRLKEKTDALPDADFAAFYQKKMGSLVYPKADRR
jgi:hypothetical protein